VSILVSVSVGVRAIPVAFILFVFVFTAIWGGVMIALLAGFRRQRADPDALARVRPLTLLDDAHFVA
jgi:hypothetical protein